MEEKMKGNGMKNQAPGYTFRRVTWDAGCRIWRTFEIVGTMYDWHAKATFKQATMRFCGPLWGFVEVLDNQGNSVLFDSTWAENARL